MRKFFLLIMIAGLSACVTKPTAEQMASADYGDYPQNFKEVIARYMTDRLKDPDSAQYRYQNYPTRGYWGLGGAKYGYVVCVSINAKNAYGGYTGYHPNYFMIKNNSVIDATIGTGGDYGDLMASSKCKNYPVDTVR